MTDILGSYAVFINDADEVMIAVGQYGSKPESAVILYDGGPHAVFYHSPEHTTVIDYIDKEARDYVAKAKTVLIAEYAKPQDEDPVTSYFVPVKHTKRMPELTELIDFDNEEELKKPETLKKLDTLLQSLIDKGLLNLDEEQAEQ